MPESGLVVLMKVDSKSLQVDLGLLREVQVASKGIAQGKAKRASKETLSCRAPNLVEVRNVVWTEGR